MSRLFAITGVLLVSFLITTAVFAQQVVVPPQFVNQSDFGTNSVFDCTSFPTGNKTQVLFPASDLISGQIVSTDARLFPQSPGFGAVSVPNVVVTFATTNQNSLSTTFADNLDNNVVEVFNGTVNVGPIPACNTDPCPFNAPLVLDIPYEYNVNDGNLVVETIVPPCVGGIPLASDVDATGVLDGIFAADPDAVNGQQAFGVITQFSFFTPKNVPTLSEWGLIAMAGILGIVGFMVIRRKKATA